MGLTWVELQSLGRSHCQKHHQCPTLSRSPLWVWSMVLLVNSRRQSLCLVLNSRLNRYSHYLFLVTYKRIDCKSWTRKASNGVVYTVNSFWSDCGRSPVASAGHSGQLDSCTHISVAFCMLSIYLYFQLDEAFQALSPYYSPQHYSRLSARLMV